MYKPFRISSGHTVAMFDSTGPLDLRLQTEHHLSGNEGRLISTYKHKQMIDAVTCMAGQKRPRHVEQPARVGSDSTTTEIFICPVCRSHSINLQHFVEHMATHIGKPTDPGRENTLPLTERNGSEGRQPTSMTETSKSTLNRNMTEKPSVASCAVRIRQSNPLSVETEVPGRSQEAQFTCSLCVTERIYPSIWELVTHVQVDHLRCFYECGSCGQKFSEKLSGLDHIFAAHFEPSAVSPGRTKPEQHSPTFSRKVISTDQLSSHRITAHSGSDGVQSDRQTPHSNESFQPSSYSNTTQFDETGLINWPDQTTRTNSTALLSYLSVQTQAIDLIGQLLWLTSGKSNAWGTLDNMHLTPVSHHTKASPMKSSVRENPEETEEVERSNKWPLQLDHSSQDLKCALHDHSPKSPSPTNKMRSNTTSKRDPDRPDRYSRKSPQIGFTKVTEMDGLLEETAPEKTQPIGAMSSLLCLFRNCSPLLSSHPVRSLLPAELASKVDSFEAAKLCHLCLKEFPDEMSVLRHQVESHSLDEEPKNKT